MKQILILATAACVVAVLGIAAEASTGNAARQAILQQLAAQAKKADPSFKGFSAKRGSQFFHAHHTGGNAQTPSCSTCHTNNPRNEGQTTVGKMIAPMAVSRSPKRFTDPAKVAKWFRRNCDTVLGRQCTPQEKGDYITYLASQ